MAFLYKELIALSKSDVYPYHMPGHKRKAAGGFLEDAYGIDITEVDGFDDLHDPKGLILEAMRRAADLYRSDETFYLINGSSCGILSSISAVAERGDKVLIARNCHRSVYNAVSINGLRAEYIYPDTLFDGEICADIRPKQVEKALERSPDARALVITSPTYEGLISDIASIARIVHDRNIPLIVDEAHGAHLFLYENLPLNRIKSSVECGADIVVNSLHKTLPALTQTALLHVNGELVDRERLKRYLSIYQTSSPSYVLMASMDHCLEYIGSEGRELFREYDERLKRFYRISRELKLLHVLTGDDLSKERVYSFDRSKIVIFTDRAGISGKELYDTLLKKYGLQPEMAYDRYCLMMTSLMDTDEGFFRLTNALNKIDKDLMDGKTEDPECFYEPDPEAERLMDRIDSLTGTKAASEIYLYPPGIPIVVRGETITGEMARQLKKHIRNRLIVKGI